MTANRAEFEAYRDELMNTIRTGGRLLRPFRVQPKLDSLFSPDWEVEWLKLAISYRCATRTRPTKTRSQLAQLRDLLGQHGRSEDFDAFYREINALMHPHTLTLHGYNTAFAAQDTDHVARSIGAILRPLEKLNYPFFLHAGALLGLIRDGSFIAHDDDIDLIIFLGECTDEEAAEKWVHYKEALCEAGLAPYGPNTDDNPPIFKILNDAGITIDICPGWTSDGKFSLYPSSYRAMESDDIFPLKSDIENTRHMFGEYEILIPAKPEKLLICCYGENWRIPDPLFKFDWRTARRNFRTILNMTYC